MKTQLFQTSWDSLARYHYKVVEVPKSKQCAISPTAIVIFINLLIVSIVIDRIYY